MLATVRSVRALQSETPTWPRTTTVTQVSMRNQSSRAFHPVHSSQYHSTSKRFISTEIIQNSNQVNRGQYVVKKTEYGWGISADRDFDEGEVVIVLKAKSVDSTPHIYSVQVGWQKHVNLEDPLQLLNHSCDASTTVRDNEFGVYDLVARRSLVRGDEITFDYETTEYCMSSEFDCLCGTEKCRGRLRGYKWNHDAVHREYGNNVAAYLLSDHPSDMDNNGPSDQQ